TGTPTLARLLRTTDVATRGRVADGVGHGRREFRRAYRGTSTNRCGFPLIYSVRSSNVEINRAHVATRTPSSCQVNPQLLQISESRHAAILASLSNGALHASSRIAARHSSSSFATTPFSQS